MPIASQGAGAGFRSGLRVMSSPTASEGSGSRDGCCNFDTLKLETNALNPFWVARLAS